MADNTKRKALKRQGTLNPRPGQIKNLSLANYWLRL